MAIIKTKGIVFKSIKYRETSLIVDIYTREKGLLSFIVNGVRKAKSRMGASLFQHSSLVDMVAYHKQGGGLSRIKEIKSAFPYTSIPYAIEKSSIALFMLELSRNSIIEEEENYPLYDFLESQFILLDQHTEKVSNLHIKFMLELTKHIGFYPDASGASDSTRMDLEGGRFVAEHFMGSYVLDVTESRYIRSLIDTPSEHVHTLSIPKISRKKIIEGMIKYYRLHIESFKPLKSYEVLQQLF